MKLCPLCNSKNSKLYMRADGWNNRDNIQLNKCINCGFVFSVFNNDDLKHNYENWGEDIKIDNYQDLIYKASEAKTDKLVNELVAKIDCKAGKSLDFGAGLGLVSIILKNKNWTTYTIEKSKHYLQIHKKYNLFAFNDIDDLKKTENSFDLIILKDVLEHLESPVYIMNELTKLLHNNGYFYIRVPNINAYPVVPAIDTRSHINHFSPKILNNFLSSLGLKKVDFINVYDVRSNRGKLWHYFFWKLRYILPLYHQISFLYKKVY